MSTTAIIILVVIVVAAAIWLLLLSRRSKRLRSKFGPESQRTVGDLGDRRKAERDLERREKRVQNLELRPLPAATRDRFLEAWRDDQARFVDDPAGAVAQADHLIAQLMSERGYPAGGFDQRADDISVAHPHLVQNYRAARELAQRQKAGQASTEDLRRALVYYRALFDELLEVHEVRP